MIGWVFIWTAGRKEKKGDLSQTMTRTWVFNTEILEMSCCRVGSPPRFKNSVKRSQSDTSCSYNTSCVSWYCETSAPSTPGEQEVHNLQTETAASHISDYISVYNFYIIYLGSWYEKLLSTGETFTCVERNSSGLCKTGPHQPYILKSNKNKGIK